MCCISLLSPWGAATRGGGFGADGWGGGLGGVWGWGRGSGFGSGDHDGENGRQDLPGHGHWFDVRNPVAMLVHAHNDIHGLATILVLHSHGVFAGVLHGHALYG